MPALDLSALLRTAKAQVSLSKPRALADARMAQRKDASAKADEYARQLEARAVLRRGITSNDADAMRFRWLCDHAEYMPRLAGQTADEVRASIDLWIKQQAIKRLSEMRQRYKQLSGRDPIPIELDSGIRSASVFGTMEHQFPFTASRTLEPEEADL